MYRFKMPLITKYPLCNVLNVAGLLLGFAAVIPPTNAHAVLFGLAAAATVGLSMLLYHRFNERAKASLPVTSVRAEVVECWTEESWEQLAGKYTRVVRHYTIFRTESGVTIRLETTEADQNRYPAGTWGTLRYREGEYLSFLERDIFAEGSREATE